MAAADLNSYETFTIDGLLAIPGISRVKSHINRGLDRFNDEDAAPSAPNGA